MGVTADNPIRLAIMDSQPIFQLGMAQLIQNHRGLQLCFVTDNSFEVVQKLKEVSVDVMILELDLPNPKTIELHQRIRSQFPEISVIYIAEKVDNLRLAVAWGSYATGVIARDIQPEKFIHAIQMAFVGLLYSSEEFQRIQNWNQEIGERLCSLKPRELEILWLIIEGNKNSEIAIKLGLSENTVEKHVSNILSKLRVTSKSLLTSFVLGQDLLLIRNIPFQDVIRRG